MNRERGRESTCSTLSGTTRAAHTDPPKPANCALSIHCALTKRIYWIARHTDTGHFTVLQSSDFTPTTLTLPYHPAPDNQSPPPRPPRCLNREYPTPKSETFGSASTTTPPHTSATSVTIRPMFVKMYVGHTSKTSQTSPRNDTRSPTGMSTHAVRPSIVANFISRYGHVYVRPVVHML